MPGAGDKVPVQSGAPYRFLSLRCVEDNRASDVHRAEGIERRTISVEAEALHNGYRYEVPIEVFVRVEGPQVRAP